MQICHPYLVRSLRFTMDTIRHRFSFLFGLIGLALLSSPAYAGPSSTSLATPSKRFNTLEGCWIISQADTGISKLNGSFFCIDNHGRNGHLGAPSVTESAASPIFVEIRSLRGSKKANPFAPLGVKRNGTFSVSLGHEDSQSYLDTLGKEGKLDIQFTGGNAFAFFFATLKPQGGAVDKVVFRADKVATAADKGFSMAIKVKKRGKLKAGEIVNFTVNLINRGSEILIPKSVRVEFLFGGVSSFSVVSTKNISSCSTSEIGGQCDLNALGPPGKNTYATLKLKAQIEDPAPSNLTLGIYPAKNNALTKILNSPRKTLKYKVKSSGCNGLSGDFAIKNSSGDITTRVRFKEQNGVYNATLLKAGGLFSGTVYKVGETVFRNFVYNAAKDVYEGERSFCCPKQFTDLTISRFDGQLYLGFNKLNPLVCTSK